jgi:hypothetical protein
VTAARGETPLANGRNVVSLYLVRSWRATRGCMR